MVKIAINAGHYPGLDSGAVGETGLQEAIVTQNIMQRAASYLRGIGYDVLEIQANELYQITDTSNAYDADIFVSIHCNAASNQLAQGTETFCYVIGGQGEKLAQCIQSQIVNSLGTIDRGVKIANFYVLRNTNCPAVLVETAFISNTEDEQLLANKTDEIAAAIARGITDYLVIA